MLTATIVHPTFTTPSGAFGVVVKKLGRAEAMKNRAEMARREVAHHVYGADGKPSGDYAWRLPEGDALFYYTEIKQVAVGFVNPPNGEDGKPIVFSDDTLWLIFDEEYDVKETFYSETLDRDIPFSISFGSYCLREYRKPETFPDPTAAPSATS